MKLPEFEGDVREFVAGLELVENSVPSITIETRWLIIAFRFLLNIIDAMQAEIDEKEDEP